MTDFASLTKYPAALQREYIEIELASLRVEMAGARRSFNCQAQRALADEIAAHKTALAELTGGAL